MKQITLRLDVRTLAELEREARDSGRTRSEHIRDVLEARGEHGEHADRVGELEEERDDLRDRLADRDRDVERLQNEKRLILQEREEKAELVEYVEEERSAEQRWRRAGIGTKLKWRVFGMPDDVEEE